MFQSFVDRFSVLFRIADTEKYVIKIQKQWSLFWHESSLKHELIRGRLAGELNSVNVNKDCGW